MDENVPLLRDPAVPLATFSKSRKKAIVAVISLAGLSTREYYGITVNFYNEFPSSQLLVLGHLFLEYRMWQEISVKLSKL